MGNASGLSRAPLPMIFPSSGLRKFHVGHVVAESGKARRCGGGCRPQRLGRGRAPAAAVVSTSDAPRISARIGAVRIADLAETPTLVEQGLFCSARSAFGKRNRTPKYETRRTKQGDRVAHVYSLQRIPKSSAN